MVDLYGHEPGNGGHSQGRPTAHRDLLYSERRLLTFNVNNPRVDAESSWQSLAASPDVCENEVDANPKDRTSWKAIKSPDYLADVSLDPLNQIEVR